MHLVSRKSEKFLSRRATLSPMEKEVLDLICMNFSTRELLLKELKKTHKKIWLGKRLNWSLANLQQGNEPLISKPNATGHYSLTNAGRNIDGA